MKFFYDNIIFSLQRAGGISLYWSELIKMVQSKKLEIFFYEKENNNIFRKLLLFQADNESCLDFEVKI
jgi:hypothetical protein